MVYCVVFFNRYFSVILGMNLHGFVGYINCVYSHKCISERKAGNRALLFAL